MDDQAVITRTEVPVSGILDCLGAAMTTQKLTANYPAITTAGTRAAATKRGRHCPAPG